MICKHGLRQHLCTTLKREVVTLCEICRTILRQVDPESIGYPAAPPFRYLVWADNEAGYKTVSLNPRELAHTTFRVQ